MLVLRPVASYPAVGGNRSPSFIAAEVDERSDLSLRQAFKGRVCRKADGVCLLSHALGGQGLGLIRGQVPDEDWKRSVEERALAFEFTTMSVGANELFMISFSDTQDIADQELVEWGDYAFSCGCGLVSKIKSNPDLAVPTTILGADAVLDIVELAWEGTFDVHGVFTRDVERLKNVARSDRNVHCVETPFYVDQIDIEGEGRRGWDLFE